jgi:fructose-1,6-bisphosphatase/inositol monophosphatase family enzyme
VPLSPLHDVDAVSQLITSVARDVVLPKFRLLAADEIVHKHTAGYVDDIVTVVDREAEAQLTAGLLDLVPSARVMGEEAAHDDPALLSLAASAHLLWIVDPLDGTHNFAAGEDGFGIMVGFAVQSVVRAAWVYLPVRRELFVAEAGSGAWLNGDPLRVPDTPGAERPGGSFFLRFMPPEVRARVAARVAGRFDDVAHAGAAAIEYTDVLRGRKDFVTYYRLLPWDHGAPALIVTEAGGTVEHLDGRPYTIQSQSQVTVVARSREIARRVRGWLDPSTDSSPGRTGE